MKVLLAGATGTLGRPLVRDLLAAGHQVVGLTRSPSAAAGLEQHGCTAIVADALDRDGLLTAVDGQQADAVVHELTALKRTPLRHRDMAATNDLRVAGTSHLIEAAQVMGATRFLTQSIVFGYGYRDHGAATLTEASPFGVPAGDAFDQHMAAMASTEQQAFAAEGIDGVALRYGLFYGADLDDVVARLRRRALPIPRSGGELAFVHHDDASAATVAALERAPGGAAINIVDDHPVSFGDLLAAIARSAHAPAPLVLPGGLLRLLAPYGGAVMTRVSMRVSHDRATSELGWTPRYPSYREFLDSAPR